METHGQSGGLPMHWPTIALLAYFLPAGIWPQEPPPSGEPTARFGTTVVMSSGLRGEVYEIPPWSSRLPKFRKLRAISTLYTTALNVPPTLFTEGFPGVAGRLEWFAIDYKGRFWIAKGGVYRFSLMSDDGSKIYIDGRRVIDNDGIHPAITREGKVALAAGLHLIRVSYFQGPGAGVALTLRVAGPGEDWRLFDMDEFCPKPETNERN